MSDVRIIHLQDELPDSEVDQLEGQYIDSSHYNTLISGESVDVYRANGEPLLKFRAKVFPKEICVTAWSALRGVQFGSANRGSAGGIVPGLEDGQKLFTGPKKTGRGSKGLLKGNVRMRPLKKDGTLSRTEYAAAYAAGDTLPSGIIGFYDRYARIPYCRMTAFNLEHPEKFAAAMPYIQAIDAVFQKEAPDRYAAQKDMVRKTSPDFVIHNTAFTTITVNKSWRTAVHKDAGDLKEGFGVMTALWAQKKKGVEEKELRMGESWGNYLIFPKFRVAVDMTAGDILLADVHQWHGNSPYLGRATVHERISLVLYYRANMIKCGSAAEERDRADRRFDPKTGRPIGMPLYDEPNKKGTDNG